MLLALFEPEARLGPERVAECGAADADRIEDRRFDDDVGRGGRDLGRRAAHDPGDPQGPGGIGDQQGLRFELTLDVVERLHALALAREADDDPAVVHGGRVEHVDRLAELQHHVVADVDDVADRSLTCRHEAHLDVVR